MKKANNDLIFNTSYVESNFQFETEQHFKTMTYKVQQNNIRTLKDYHDLDKLRIKPETEWKFLKENDLYF